MKQMMMASGALALALVASGPLSAAIYVKIPDIDGESETRADSGDAHLDYLVITMEHAQENRTTPFETEDIGAKATGASADGVETEDIGFRSSDGDAETTGDDHSAGDEHEITYDVAAGALHSQGAHQATHVVQQRGSGGGGTADHDHGHDKWIDVLSWGSAAGTTTREAGSGMATGRRMHRPMATRDAASGRATGKRQHKPAVLTKAIDKASPLRVPVSEGPGTLRVDRAMDGCVVSAQYPYVLVGDDGVAGAEVKLERVTVTECSSEHVSFAYEKVS